MPFFGIRDSREDFTYGQSVAMAGCAFAFRKINPDYTGDCCIVRRSSDSAELTVGWSSDEIDLGSIEAWAGSDSVYVKTWYDQSGNGRDVTQLAGASQPRLYNAGVLETMNSQPCIYFDNNDLLTNSSPSWIAGVYYAYTAATCPDETTASSWYIGTRSASGPNNYLLQIGYNGSNSYKIAQWNNDATFTPTWSNGSIYVHSGKKNNPAGSTLWQNGSLISTQANPSNIQLNAATTFTVGAGGGDSNYFKGWIGEVVVWAYSISSSQLLVSHADQRTRFGV